MRKLVLLSLIYLLLEYNQSPLDPHVNVLLTPFTFWCHKPDCTSSSPKTDAFPTLHGLRSAINTFPTESKLQHISLPPATIIH